MRLVNVGVGVAAGLAFWYFVPEYGLASRALARLAVPVAFGHGWQLGGAENAILYRPDGTIAATVLLRYITTNVITLVALFALPAAPLSVRNLFRCLVAIACLIPIHAAAILTVAKSVVLPGSLWGNAAQAYTIFGSQPISFAIWSLLRPADSAASASEKAPRKRTRRKS
jgi:hypothetical protein